MFLPDALALADAKKAICEDAGLVGVFPLDGGLDLEGLTPIDAGLAISRANEDLMRSCDLLIANMTPFRGPSMDVGTAFEMGFMRALGRPVFGYTNAPGTYAERVGVFYSGAAAADEAGRPLDPDGNLIEDFGMIDNLMMVGAVAASGTEVATGESGSIQALDAFRRCIALATKTINSGV